MRAFLNKFFARHYFQVQDSLVDYMTSEDFHALLDTQELRILDIGSGPAVASLAISDMVACILDNLRQTNQQVKGRKVRISYVLNVEDLKKSVKVLDEALKVYPGRTNK